MEKGARAFQEIAVPALNMPVAQGKCAKGAPALSLSLVEQWQKAIWLRTILHFLKLAQWSSVLRKHACHGVSHKRCMAVAILKQVTCSTCLLTTRREARAVVCAQVQQLLGAPAKSMSLSRQQAQQPQLGPSPQAAESPSASTGVSTWARPSIKTLMLTTRATTGQQLL